jgi:hypothetical protein
MPDSAAESQKHHLSKIRPHGLASWARATPHPCPPPHRASGRTPVSRRAMGAGAPTPSIPIEMQKDLGRLPDPLATMSWAPSVRFYPLDSTPNALATSQLSRCALSPPRFLSRKDFVAFAIEDPHADRLGGPLYVRSGDYGRRRIRHFNLLFRQIRRALVDRPANELDPEGPRLFRNNFSRRIRLGKCRRRSVRPEAPGRPAGDD